MHPQLNASCRGTPRKQPATDDHASVLACANGVVESRNVSMFGIKEVSKIVSRHALLNHSQSLIAYQVVTLHRS